MEKAKIAKKFIRVDESLIKQIEQIAEDMHASVTWTVEYLLRSELKRLSEKDLQFFYFYSIK